MQILIRIIGADPAIKRRAKGLTLTAAGRTVPGQARALLDLAGELESLGQGTPASLGRLLTVGCFMSLGPTPIPTMLRAFAEPCPDVEVDFAEGYHADLQQALLDGSIDAAFLYGASYGAQIVPSLSSAPVTNSELCVLVPTEHRLSETNDAQLADITGEPLVLFDADPISRRMLGPFEAAGIAPTVRHRSRSYATVRALVGSGRGVALLFQQPEIEAPCQELGVVLKRLRASGLPGAELVPVSVVWPRSTKLNFRTQARVEVASELFAHATPLS